MNDYKNRIKKKSDNFGGPAEIEAEQAKRIHPNSDYERISE